MALPYILARRSYNFGRSTTLPLLVFNFVLGLLVLVQGCLSFRTADVRHIMLGLVCLVFGLIMCVMEFLHWAVFRMHASFLFSFFGRGLFYFMCGCLTIDANTSQLGIGIVLVVFGVIYMCLTFATSMYFDDPEDEYAMVIYNMQHGFYEGKLGHDGLGKKSVHSMGMFSGQGISSETYTASESYAPQLAGFSSGMGAVEVPKRSTSNSGTRYPSQPAAVYHMQTSV